MNIRRKHIEGESKDLLLKEYFLNAYLIAMLKQLGGEVRRRVVRDNDRAAKEAKDVAMQN